MSFKRKREKYINDVKEFNDLLLWAKDHKFICMGECEGELNYVAYIEDKLTKTELTMKKDGVACTYIFPKDERDNMQQISGMSAFIQLAKAFNLATGYHMPEFEEAKSYGAGCALLAFNKKYDGKRTEAYSYDVNMAYAWGLCQPMPDTREAAAPYGSIVKEGQIGFKYTEITPVEGFDCAGDTALVRVPVGKRADYIFNLMESPFKKFATTWFNRRLNAKTPEEKAKAKQMICYSVGYLQRKNPFLRAAVVEYANEYIKSYIDSDTIYINTDCLVSLKPRDDMPIGTGLGEFKQDHRGLFACDGFNYQWNDEIPTYRGVPKSWFKEGWDILKDPLPPNGNKYELNGVTLQMEEQSYGKENIMVSTQSR